MIIDFHSHVTLPQAPDAPLTNVEEMIRLKKDAGIDVNVISSPMLFEYSRRMNITHLDAIKKYHEYAGHLQERYPESIVPLSCTYPFGGGEYVDELKDAVSRFKFRGVMVNSSVNGEYLDSPRAKPFFEAATSLELLVFIHPPFIPIGADFMKDYRLISIVGRPFDITLSLARLVLGGVLERFPSLKIVCSHAGGTIAMLSSRLDAQCDTLEHSKQKPYDESLTRKPSDYIKKLYYDSVCLSVPALECVIQTAGIDRMVFGTDYPPNSIPPETFVRFIENMPLDAVKKSKIFAVNAQQLLHL